jgi:hypothetical protein
MKKSQLALAVFTAAALLAACDDSKKPAEKGATTAQTASATAEQIEARYQADVDQVNALYKKIYASGPNANLFRKYDYSVNDYQKTEQGATAKTTLSLELNPQIYGEKVEPVTLHFTDIITSSKELQDKGIVARVEHKLDNKDEFKPLIRNFAAVSGEAPSEAADKATEQVNAGLSFLFDHLYMQTDLLPEDNAVATIAIKAFQRQDGDDSLDFKGFNSNIRYNNKTQLDGFYNLDFALEPLTFTATDKEDGDTSTVSIAATKGGWSFKEDGSFQLKVDPFKTETTNAKGMTTFEIGGVEGKGENMKFDSAIGTYLGKADVNVKGIRLTHNTDNISLGDINVQADAKKTASDNYDSAATVTFKLDGASLKQALPVLSVEPQSLRVHVGLSELSAAGNNALVEGLQLLNPQLAAAGNSELIPGELSPETRDKFKTALDEIIKNKTRLNTEIAAQTDAGKAQFTASVGIRNDSTAQPEEWQKAINEAQDSPLHLQNLLKANLDLHAEFRISKSLVDKLGFTEIVEQQGAKFITLEDGEYLAKIENKEGTITVNGNPL